MPLQHYLPASFLGRFSLDSTLPARNRSLWACNRFNAKPFPSRANKLAGINNLYAVADQSKNGINIDDIWSKYEKKLNISLDSFIAGDYDAESWLRVLVPFVTCLLVRGPDFNKRFARRLGDLSQLTSDDNTNHARIMELQRLLGPVCAAKWIIFETKGAENLITNDVGYAPFHYPITKEYGMAIPIGLRHILGIIPCDDRLVLTKKGRKWIPIVERMPLGEGNHLLLNRAISRYAHNSIFGCDEKIVTTQAPESKVMGSWLHLILLMA